MTRIKSIARAISGRHALTAREWGILTIATAVLALVLTEMGSGQSLGNARSLGMAGSHSLLTSGADAGLRNPAALSLSNRTQTAIQLFSVGGHAANNSFSFSDYKKYNGAYWSAEDKQEIIDRIPDGGLVFDLAGSAGGLAISVGKFALNFEAIAGGRGQLSKDPIEVALTGNKVGQMITADGSDGDAWAAAAASLSGAQSLFKIDRFQVHGGATLRYLRGLGLFSALEVSGEAVTLATGFEGEGALKTISATGGNGYAFDIGFAAEGAGWQFGAGLRNMIANIKWDRDVEFVEYTFHAENATIESEDSLIVSEETHVPMVKYYSRPAMELELTANHQFGKLLASTGFRQGFSDAAFVSKNPRLSVGAEYPLIGLLDVRSGLSVGGYDRLSLAFGLGINLGPLNLDLAYASTAKLQPWDGNGGQLALATYLEF